LEKIVKKFDLFGIQTHPIPLNPHGLRANRTSPNASTFPDMDTKHVITKRMLKRLQNTKGMNNN
jgi:hypothetical protein